MDPISFNPRIRPGRQCGARAAIHGPQTEIACDVSGRSSVRRSHRSRPHEGSRRTPCTLVSETSQGDDRRRTCPPPAPPPPRHATVVLDLSAQKSVRNRTAPFLSGGREPGPPDSPLAAPVPGSMRFCSRRVGHRFRSSPLLYTLCSTFDQGARKGAVRGLPIRTTADPARPKCPRRPRALPLATGLSGTPRPALPPAGPEGLSPSEVCRAMGAVEEDALGKLRPS